MSEDRTKIKVFTNPLTETMKGITYQKNIEFEVPYMSRVAENLWQGGCAPGLILPSHINVLISLYPWERYTILHDMRLEMYYRMHDDPMQDLSQVDTLAEIVNTWRAKGRQVLVHCQAGLNRSSVVVARALMMEGMSADEAINLLRDKRSPACLCNQGFEDWLRSL